MWQYLALGGIISAPALLGLGNRADGRHIIKPLWVAVFVLLVLFVGLRHNVGMDWNNYLVMMWRSENAVDLLVQLRITEPGYALLLFLGDLSGLGVYAVNFLSAIIITGSIFYFSRRTPEPWLALLAAYPFYILVFAMSANRQALAASLLMVVIINWEKLSIRNRVLLIIGCSMFHYSALIFLIFVATDLRLDLFLKIAVNTVLSGIALYFLAQSEQVQRYDELYVTGGADIISDGAFYHIMLNALPAALYFVFPRARSVLFPTKILRHIAFAALLSVPLALVFSTIASRLNFYWVPMSMYALAALPSALILRSRAVIRLVIVAAMLAVAVLWLSYANSAGAYLPYQNYFTTPEPLLEYRYRPY